MEIRQIASVLAIVENGSFRKAARQLYLGQPTLSQHVRSLEVELGVTLFTRSATGATLTRAGEQLIPRFHRVLATIDHLHQDAEELSAGGAGRVRVAAVSAAIAPGVVPALQHLQATHPRLRITLTELQPSAIEEAVHSGVVDIGVVGRSVTSAPAGERHEVLQTGSVGLLVPRGSSLATTSSITRDRLAHEQVILLPHGHLLRRFADGYFCDDALQNAYEVSHQSTVERLVHAGLGVAVGPDRGARNDLTVCRPIADAQLDWALLMITHRAPSAVAAVVASAIRLSFRGLPTPTPSARGEDQR